LTGLRAFDETEELEPYLDLIKRFAESGPLTASASELRDRALKLLPHEIINQIMAQEERNLVI
jgi:hypothetical protein